MTLNIDGILREWTRPLVMGIINVTPDSFYSASRRGHDEAVAAAEAMAAEGCDIIDIGGYSTRPDAAEVSEEEELRRLIPAVRAIRRSLGRDLLISVDTFRARVARKCVEAGADIINDVAGGTLDSEMPATVAELRRPYILMHMRGTPADMQTLTDYDDVTADILRDLAFKTDCLREQGVADIIIDPGFGFAKTLDQNYRLLAELKAFRHLGCPVLAGMSRKSMICKELGITPTEALNGTTALNMAALIHGADILRVHDVREAAQTVRLFEAIRRNSPAEERIISITDTPKIYTNP